MAQHNTLLDFFPLMLIIKPLSPGSLLSFSFSFPFLVTAVSSNSLHQEFIAAMDWPTPIYPETPIDDLFDDAAFRLFGRLGLLPRRYPCPWCTLSPLWSFHTAQLHVLRQSFDPRVWRSGEHTFCPPHVIMFLAALENAGRVVRPSTVLPPPVVAMLPHDTPCPSCFPTTELALYRASADALGRRFGFISPPWYRSPYAFCDYCEDRLFRTPGAFRRRHRTRTWVVTPVVTRPRDEYW